MRKSSFARLWESAGTKDSRGLPRRLAQPPEIEDRADWIAKLAGTSVGSVFRNQPLALPVIAMQSDAAGFPAHAASAMSARLFRQRPLSFLTFYEDRQVESLLISTNVISSELMGHGIPDI